jgi:hypothetical protein
VVIGAWDRSQRREEERAGMLLGDGAEKGVIDDHREGRAASRGLPAKSTLLADASYES